MTRRFPAALLGLVLPLLWPLVSSGMQAGVARPLPTVLVVPALKARRH